MTTWLVLTGKGLVKIGWIPRWPEPKCFGLETDEKKQVLRDFIASGAWKETR